MAVLPFPDLVPAQEFRDKRASLRDSFAAYNYSIPALLTEFGCTSKGFPTVEGYEAQRTFHDAKWMNTDPYSQIFNGGFVFEYSTENANSKSTSPYPFTAFGPQNYGLGYFSPEDCDDVAVTKNCTYKRMPNYHYLALAYNSTDTSAEPTLTKYQVPSTRSKRSTCPSGFAKLSNFTWTADSTASQKCVSSNFTCPNIKYKFTSTSRDAGASTSGSSGVAIVGQDDSTNAGGAGVGDSSGSGNNSTVAHKSGGVPAHQQPLMSAAVAMVACLAAMLA